MSARSDVQVAIGVYDRTRPLLDGTVGRDLPLRFVAADTQTSTFGLLEGKYEIGEMSLATYAKAREESDRLQAIPVFTHRKFFHQYIWVRRGAGIRRLRDLAGRSVVAPMYWMTSSIWHRMILEDEANLSARDLRWLVLAKDRLPSMRPPDGVSVEVVAGRSAVELVTAGDADALLTAATTPDLLAVRDRLERPFEDVGRAQRLYFERTRIFPPVHAIVCRRTLLTERPEIVGALTRAIEQAKREAYARLEDESRTSLPFIREHLEETRRAFDGDPYRDGLEANRVALAAFADAAHRQGLTSRRLGVEELFQPIGDG